MQGTAGMRAASGRRRPAWDRWPDTFWLGRWSLSLQPPPLPLSPSRPSRTCVRVWPPATGRAQRDRPASPWRAVGRLFRVVPEWREVRERRRGPRPARRRGRSARPARAGITNRNQGLERSNLGADVGTHAVRPSRAWRVAVASGAACG